MFLAVRPPPAVAAELHRLERPDGSGVRWEDPAQWHITIRFFPRAPVDEVIAAVDQLAPLAAPTVVLGPEVKILGKGVVMVPAAGLDGLAVAVDEVTSGFERAAGSQGRPFTGHLTLGRLRRGHRTCQLVGRPVGATFIADEMQLVVSAQHAGGHRHRIVHRWGLGSTSAA